jgi:2'-5' RNA ligase
MDSPNGRRLFFALPVSEEMRANLADAAERLRKASVFSPVRPAWVAPENYHVTIHFLSRVHEDVAARVIDGFPALIAGIPQFKLDVRHVGFFPHEKAPNVFWAGVWKAQPELLELHRRLGAWASGLGIRVDDRPYHGHVTLARFKSMRGTAIFVQQAQKFRHAHWGVATATEVHLMESFLAPEGARYEIIGRGPLRERPAAQPAEPDA